MIINKEEMSSQHKISFKVFANNNQSDLRRITYHESEISYQNIIEISKAKFSKLDSSKLYLKYKDQQNEWVTIKSNPELLDALVEMGKSK